MHPDDRVLPELEFLLAQAEAMQKSVRDATAQRNQFLRMLRACYNKALKDPDTRIPSYLHAALENVVALIPEQQPNAPDPIFAQALKAMAGQVGP